MVSLTRTDWPRLSERVADVDAIVHLAGINRGPAAELESGNVRLAQDLAEALGATRRQPTVIFANSIQAGGDTPYGRGKQEAADVLAAEAAERGLIYVDLVLPNIFGEHGRPRYNSVVATFVEAVIRGQQPHLEDRPIALVHAQTAAASIVQALQLSRSQRLEQTGTPTSVGAVLTTLRSFHAVYATGDLPPLVNDLEVDLFNTLRAALFPGSHPMWPAARSDHRGSLTEIVRSHGGEGQTFVSTTKPGQTRGEHFHLRKVERFVVLQGRARISLRRLFEDETVSFDLDGRHLGMVDMPTMWAHNITNIGDTDLTTLFWTNELFDPDRPDTYPERVDRSTPNPVVML